MKHSNICYILENTPQGRSYKEVNGKRYKNNYDLDLFSFIDNYGENITEAKTGLKIYTGIPTDFDKFVENCGGIERIREKIEAAIEQYGMTPRYTEPYKRKEKKPKDNNLVLSRYLYSKSKGYFRRFYNDNGIELFCKKSSEKNGYHSVYAPCNGWMIELGSNGNLESIIEKISDKNFSIHNWLVEYFNTQLADSNKWADVGVAEYLNRVDEANAHNSPIEAQRKAKREAEHVEKAAKKAAFIKDKQAEYNNAIEAAKNNIRNGATVVNTTVTIFKDEYSSSEKSLILALFKKYNIDMPLKTQGWVNNALANIEFDGDGRISYRYYTHSQNSTVFKGYLEQLVSVIKSNI